MSYFVAAFYHFFDFPDHAEWREPLEQFCAAHSILGTILLASEGINATVAGTPADVAALLAKLRQEPRMAALVHKESTCEAPPFHRLKVRLRREIVTMGVEGISPTERTGVYTDPQEWNALLDRDDVVVLDTRNDYEVAVGTFPGALNPGTVLFREFPAWVDQNLDPARTPRVAMFCTGGIRCEKASALLLARGFQEVYQLHGGILRYLEETPIEESRWEGECFVFDDRIAVDHNLAPGTTRLEDLPPSGRGGDA